MPLKREKLHSTPGGFLTKAPGSMGWNKRRTGGEILAVCFALLCGDSILLECFATSRFFPCVTRMEGLQVPDELRARMQDSGSVAAAAGIPRNSERKGSYRTLRWATAEPGDTDRHMLRYWHSTCVKKGTGSMNQVDAQDANDRFLRIVITIRNGRSRHADVTS